MRYEDLPEIKKAQELCAAYGVCQSAPQIDLAKVMSDRGITFVSQSLSDEISGALDMREGKRVILVNSRHSKARQRFSAAHELGHFFIAAPSNEVHMSAATFFRNALSSKGTDEGEKKANRFAAELLMPSPILRKILLDSWNVIEADDGRALKQIADTFGVSVPALTVKIAGLVKTL